jgi:hypothetical protein
MGTTSRSRDNALGRPPPKKVSASHLLLQLRRAAGMRALITLGSEIVALFSVSIILAIAHLEPQRAGPAVLFLCVFGIPLLVCWTWTVKVCHTSVTCPSCGDSLWSCGTGNFKARRMRIKKEIHRCPHCGIPIS